MPTALVTGSPERVPDVAIALKSEGFDILSADPEPPSPRSGVAPGSVDCYVQLPNSRVAAGDSTFSRTRSLIAEELLARFDATAQLAPLLAPQATVVLVADQAGQHTASTSGREASQPDGAALRSLVGLLAEAILADHGRDGVRATVVDGNRDPSEIAALARGRHAVPWSTYSNLEPDLSFADWRDEVFCLLSSG